MINKERIKGMCTRNTILPVKQTMTNKLKSMNILQKTIYPKICLLQGLVTRVERVGHEADEWVNSTLRGMQEQQVWDIVQGEGQKSDHIFQ